VILCLGIGFAVQYFTDWAPAPAVGFFVGLFAARLVPAKTACSIAPRES